MSDPLFASSMGCLECAINSSAYIDYINYSPVRINRLRDSNPGNLEGRSGESQETMRLRSVSVTAHESDRLEPLVRRHFMIAILRILNRLLTTFSRHSDGSVQQFRRPHPLNGTSVKEPATWIVFTASVLSAAVN